MVCIPPDIAHLMGVAKKFVAIREKKNWQAVKWILRYLKGTGQYYLCFDNNDDVLEGHIDANMVGIMDTRKSTIGFLYAFAGVTMS